MRPPLGRRFPTCRTLCLLTPVVLTALVRAAAGDADVAAFYEENCAVCHTIGGGDQAGPDLKGSTDRKDRQWLVRFLLDPEGVVRSGDEYAAKLVAEWDGTVMPAIEGLTADMAEELVEHIEKQSRHGGEAAPAAAAPLVFTAADRARGLDIFTGRTRLTNAGPSCVSCHALGGIDGTSGGMLGPDLAAVHKRLGGARGTTAWLARPPTPMMRAMYRQASLTEDESRSLAALFESASAVSVAPATQRRSLLLAGVTGTITGLAALGLAGRGRLRSVRRRLLDDARGRNRR